MRHRRRRTVTHGDIAQAQRWPVGLSWPAEGCSRMAEYCGCAEGARTTGKGAHKNEGECATPQLCKEGGEWWRAEAWPSGCCGTEGAV